MVFECHFVKGSRNGETSTYSFKTSRPPNDLYWNTRDGIMIYGEYLAIENPILTEAYRLIWWEDTTAVYRFIGIK